MDKHLSLQANLIKSAKSFQESEIAARANSNNSSNQELVELIAEWDKILGSVYGSRLDKRLSWDGITNRRDLTKILDSLYGVSSRGISSNHIAANREDAKDKQTIIEGHSDSPWKNGDESIKAACSFLPFADVFAPIIIKEYNLLLEYIEAQFHENINKERVLVDLAIDLAQLLCQEACQILYAKFNQERPVEELIKAHQQGRNNNRIYPRDLYNNFCSQCRKSQDQFLAEYPGLNLQINTVIQHWKNNSRRILDRLTEDWLDICNFFELPASSSVEHIRLGKGDRHAQGQTVCVINIHSEEIDSCLVYKPRNMAIDLALNKCIDVANSSKLPGKIRKVKTLNKSTHGYCEFIEHKPCESADELKLFYQNFGRLIALLHCLGATDCHYENIIACGTEPVLVDSETLFEPKFATDLKNDLSYPGAELRERLGKSVMRTMTIPRWSYATKSFKASELTALGVFSPQGQEEEIDGWLAINSNGMLPGKTKVATKSANSLPVKAGTDNPLANYTEELIKGFELQMKSILENRTQWLLQNNGCLSAFREVPRRLVFRATSIYGALLDQARSPKASKSLLQKGLIFESMARAFIGQIDKPTSWTIFHDECEQIAKGDIPFFWSTCNGLDIYNYSGEKVVESYISKSGLCEADEALQGLNKEEIDFQIEIINGSLVNRFGADSSNLRSLQKKRQSSRIIEKNLLTKLDHLSEFSEPARIMRHLLLTSIPSEGSLCWLGPTAGPDLKSLSFGLMDDTPAVGAAGIGLFFALCCHSFPDLQGYGEELTFSALRNYLTFFSQADKQRLRKWWIDTPAGLSGTGGALLFFGILETLGLSPKDLRWNSFMELQEELLSCINFEDFLSQPYESVSAGLAGLIPPLFNLGTPTAIEIALSIGNELVKKQEADGTWVNNNIVRTGFAHGNAGIAAVLAFLSGQTGEAKFAAACHRAIVAENKLKSIEYEGWRDLRYEVDKNVYTQLWCQGSTGIAMSRLIMLKNSCCQDEALSDLKLAIMGLLHTSDHGIDDLCCGLSGITSVLNILADDDHIGWLEQTGWSADSVKEKAKELQSTMVMGARPRGHYRTFIANGTTELLSLMTGLAGIGLSQLDSQPAKIALRTWLSCGMLPSHAE